MNSMCVFILQTGQVNYYLKDYIHLEGSFSFTVKLVRRFDPFPVTITVSEFRSVYLATAKAFPFCMGHSTHRCAVSYC